MSSAEESKQVVAAREIYMNHLRSLMTPIMMQKMFRIYESLKDVKDGKSNLRRFQDNLREIPNWNQHMIDSETQLMSKQTEPGLLEDLITTIMVSNAEILSTINVVATTNKINLKIPKMNVFIHNCYIELARKLYKNVFLFADDINNTEKQKNLQAIETLTWDAIEVAVQKALPVHDIIKQYVTGGGDAKTAHDALDNIQDPDVARALIEEGKNNNDDDSQSDKIAVVKEDDIKEIKQPDEIVLDSLSLLDENESVENTPSGTGGDEHESSSELPCEDYIAPEDDIRPPEEDAPPLSIDDIFIVEPTEESGEKQGESDASNDNSETNNVSLGKDDFNGKNDDIKDTSFDDDELPIEDEKSQPVENEDNMYRNTVVNTESMPPVEVDADASPVTDELEIYFTDDSENEPDPDTEDVDLTLGGNTASDSDAENDTSSQSCQEERPSQSNLNHVEHNDVDLSSMKNDSDHKIQNDDKQISSQDDKIPLTTEDVRDTFTDSKDDSDDDLLEYDDTADDILPLPTEETSDLTDSDMEGISFTDDDLYSDQEEVDDMLSSLTNQNRSDENSQDKQPKSVSKLEAFIGELAPKSCYKDKSDDDIPFSKPIKQKSKTRSKSKPKTRREETSGSTDDDSGTEEKSPHQLQRTNVSSEQKPISKHAQVKEKIELFPDAASDSD